MNLFLLRFFVVSVLLNHQTCYGDEKKSLQLRREPPTTDSSDIYHRPGTNSEDTIPRRNHKVRSVKNRRNNQLQKRQNYSMFKERSMKIKSSNKKHLKKNGKSSCYNTRYLYSTTSGKSWKAELINAAKRYCKGNSIVITAGDWSYRAVILNWIAHANHIGVTEYIVLCYGEKMFNLVGPWSQGGHGILVEGCTDLLEFMLMKVVTIYYLNSVGYTVTWSDSDCMWLRPFLGPWIMDNKMKADIIGQKGLHPTKISGVTGTVLCTGLFTVFPNSRTVSFFSKLIDIVYSYSTESDQNFINSYLLAAGSYDFSEKVIYNEHIENSQNLPILQIPVYSRDYKSVQTVLNFEKNANTSKQAFKTSRTFLFYNRPYVEETSPRLAFLPLTYFPRAKSSEEWQSVKKNNPKIWHSRSEKTGRSKLDTMNNDSVFVLNNHWRSIKSIADLNNYVIEAVFTDL